jgi:hypothetical protein
VDRLPLTNDARAVLRRLLAGPAFYDVIEKALKRTADVPAGTSALLDAKLVDGEVQKHTNRRGRPVDRLLLTMRPVEKWEDDALFLAAVGVRW